MRRRSILVAIVVAALAALSVTAVVLLGSGDGTAQLRASSYPQAIPAPATLGADQDGRPIQVPRAGRPAVVTFLFANCPDVCPTLAQQISRALDEVGPEASEVDVVAISVDPRGDTPRAVRAFLDLHRLQGRMRYLVGTRAQLQPIWRAWSIRAQPSDNIIQSTHTARVVLVDRQGRQLASYPGGIPFRTEDLAADIRTLISG